MSSGVGRGRGVSSGVGRGWGDQLVSRGVLCLCSAETKLAMLEEGEGKHPPEPALGEGTCQRFCLNGKEPYRFANETMVCFGKCSKIASALR